MSTEIIITLVGCAVVLGTNSYTLHKLNKKITHSILSFQESFALSPVELERKAKMDAFNGRIDSLKREISSFRNGGLIAEEVDGVRNLPHTIIGRHDTYEEVAE